MSKMRINMLLLMILGWISFFSCQNSKNTSSSGSRTESGISKTEKMPIGPKLAENNHLSIEDRIELYHRLKIESPDAYTFDNLDDITMYGYSLLWNDKTDEAIAIFKLIVSEYPDYANGYDSLGEAYLKSGDKKLALANYEKSVKMDSLNYFGAEQINRIKNPDYVPERSRFDQVFTKKKYCDDLDQLGNTLIQIHPNALKFITKEDFQKTIEQKKGLITDHTTYGEFIWHCSEIIANTNCSHTSMGNFFHEWQLLPHKYIFPLEVRWINDHLYVVANNGNEDHVSIKDEILSINGMAVSDLIQDIFKHIPSQGHIKTSKKYDFEKWAPGMIPYALGFPDKYEVLVQGKESPVVLNSAQEEQSYYSQPLRHHYPEERLSLEMLEEDQTAILNIASFNYYWWNNLDFFEQFIDSCFVEMNEKGVENLIIDVRYNGGGSPEASIHLLKYLIDEPFVYYASTPDGIDEGLHYPFEKQFEGNLFFLIDGNGNSTTGHFMAVARDLKLGTIIGEELGSNQFCTAGQTIRRLSNTGLEYYIPNSTCISSATSSPEDRGILPDHYIAQSIDDYLDSIDRVKVYTMELIAK
ncbi:MAG: S41 family peptidase [Chitinophagales bacterium]|nr:S41 family peptidase [Chitinophagales bacterium]